MKKNSSTIYTSSLQHLLEVDSPKDNITEIEDEIKMMRATTENTNILTDNKKRGVIAIIFTWAFVFFIGVILIFIPIYNATFGKENTINQTDLFDAFNASFGTILGFVLGYYFKDKK